MRNAIRWAAAALLMASFGEVYVPAPNALQLRSRGGIAWLI
jgi:hypothetical protein